MTPNTPVDFRAEHQRAHAPRAVRWDLILIAVSAVLLLVRGPSADPTQPPRDEPPAAPNPREQLAGVRIPFVANDGARDPRISFYAATFAGMAYVTRTGQLVYAFTDREKVHPGEHASRPALSERIGPPESKGRPLVLTETFAGGRAAQPRGGERSSATVNEFRGSDAAKWRRHIPTYDSISLGEVYDGVEVQLTARGSTVEKVFTVKPGAAPERIRIRLQGGEDLRVSTAGELQVATDRGEVRFSKPVAYQDTNGTRTFIEVAYSVAGHEYGFRLGDYDRGSALVIDPILAATFVGGSRSEMVTALATDAGGNIYAAGHGGTGNYPLDFPGIGPGSADPSHAGFEYEGFVIKFDAQLKNTLAATYLGGSGHDTIWALAVDQVGNVYVGGATWSADFPGVGPLSADNVLGGASDAFVARLDSSLSAAPVTTYLGGSSGGIPEDGATYPGEIVTALLINLAGNLVVAGFTHSADFPGVTAASVDSTYAGWNEAFVATLDPGLSVPPVSTYLGGTDCEGARALAIHPAGDIYVGGFTRSSDFPTVGAALADHTYEGETEGWIARLDPSLTAGVTTFLGGTEDFGVEAVVGLAIGNGTLYAAGFTNATDFPGIGAGSVDSLNTALDPFVVRLTLDLDAILASTFLGGNFWDYATAIVVDDSGVVWVAGDTTSYHAFPDPDDGEPQMCPGGGSASISYSAFVGSLDPTLSTLLTFKCLAPRSEAFALVAAGNTVYVGGGLHDWLDTPIESDAADPDFAGDEGYVVRIGPISQVQKRFYATVNRLKLLIPPCDCPEWAKASLVQKLDEAIEQAKMSHVQAAGNTLRQFISAVEGLVRSDATAERGTAPGISERDARDLLALAEQALAELPAVAAGEGR